jgi:hypothetical protein
LSSGDFVRRAEAARAIAAARDDGLVWPEFGNAGDDALTW